MIATHSSPPAARSRRTSGKREVKDDEHRDDEEQHCRERVTGAQLEQQVFARERTHVGEVAHASARRVVANGSTRAGSWVATRKVRPPRSSASCASSSSAPCVVERRVRLVEHEQRGIVQKHAAERKPLRHAARIRGHAIASRVPQAEAFEQHSDPLTPLRYAIEAAVELEVLERGELAIDEWLVREIADPAALHCDA